MARDSHVPPPDPGIDPMLDVHLKGQVERAHPSYPDAAGQIDDYEVR